MPDGRWEPFPGNQNIRYAFDATILILDGLREYELMHPQFSKNVIEAQKRGQEFLLNHRLYKSIQSGEELDKKITLFSFPPRWHYDVLVALDHFQSCQAEKDERLKEAINLSKESATEMVAGIYKTSMLERHSLRWSRLGNPAGGLRFEPCVS
jgi:hypothetical protein